MPRVRVPLVGTDPPCRSRSAEDIGRQGRISPVTSRQRPVHHDRSEEAIDQGRGVGHRFELSLPEYPSVLLVVRGHYAAARHARGELPARDNAGGLPSGGAAVTSAQVSGTVLIRPVRVGLLLEPTETATHRAAELATSTWGGL